MGSSIDLALDAVRSSLGFTGEKWRDLLVPFAKVTAAEYGIFLLAGIVIAIAALLGIGGALAGVDSLVAFALAGALAAIVIIPATAFSSAVSMVAYRIVDAPAGRQVPVLRSAWDMLVPAAVYLLVFYGAITAAVGVLLIAGLLLFSAGPLVGTAAVIALTAVSVLFALMLGFFLQFAPLEIALGGADGIGSMRRSYALVRKNMASVLIFDIIVFAIALAIGVAFSVINQILSFGFALSSVFPLLLILVILAWAVVFFVQSMISALVMVPLMHGFWLAIGGKR